MASSPWSEAPAAERYAVDFENGPRITIENYNPRWADYFQSIKSDIESDLSDEKITYQSIEHIGSTSVPGLASKAITDPSSDIFRQSIIDICIIVAKEEFTAAKLGQFREALLWGKRQGGYNYIGDGGVQDRWSFKVRGILPLRNLYVVAEQGIPLRAYISLRDTLRNDAHLRSEYEATKRESAELHPDDEIAYCTWKRPMIRKIFLNDGWTNEEVDMAEEQSKRDRRTLTPADFYEEHGIFRFVEDGEGAGVVE